ncbi:sigma-70 family RNA polymerase sigma factor [Lentilactobacillus kribbianus]|uniref:sigma-70 family RNA polymerase sigma factor n=1 Tax=Lentilactobacillus kribbianus TaxID=2729622 RepID=UPI001552DACB|nr:sigma-70 family RNA polymerase sigma factor [Lentilactobacillus kribbianus]
MTNDEIDLIQLVAEGDSLALKQLFLMYQPVVNSLRSQFFIIGFDKDDWYQEARLVLFHSAQRFNPTKQVTFGSFYKRNLRNRIIDLIRATQAQKRAPKEAIASLEAHPDYYDDLVIDKNSVSPEATTVLHDSLNMAYRRFSPLEQQAFLAMLSQTNVSPQSRAVVNAFERCKHKYRDSID